MPIRFGLPRKHQGWAIFKAITGMEACVGSRQHAPILPRQVVSNMVWIYTRLWVHVRDVEANPGRRLDKHAGVQWNVFNQHNGAAVTIFLEDGRARKLCTEFFDGCLDVRFN